MPRGETQHEHVWLDVLRWIAETRDIAISGHQRRRTVALACRGALDGHSVGVAAAALGSSIEGVRDTAPHRDNAGAIIDGRPGS
jgi:hypothetical protein